jgi:hypothetical protein
MQKLIRSRVLAALMLAAISVPAIAGPEDRPSDYAMIGDILVARPIGLVFTAVGAVAFVVSLPFTAASGGIPEAADTLVVGPAKETFVRCLGCKTAGYYVDPNDASH